MNSWGLVSKSFDNYSIWQPYRQLRWRVLYRILRDKFGRCSSSTKILDPWCQVESASVSISPSQQAEHSRILPSTSTARSSIVFGCWTFSTLPRKYHLKFDHPSFEPRSFVWTTTIYTCMSRWWTSTPSPWSDSQESIELWFMTEKAIWHNYCIICKRIIPSTAYLFFWTCRYLFVCRGLWFGIWYRV